MPDIILRNKEMIKETITLEIILKIIKTCVFWSFRVVIDWYLSRRNISSILKQ